MMTRALCVLAAIVVFNGTPSTQRITHNYDEEKAGSYLLPDPLVFENGEPVKTREDWTRRRRPELIRLFETHMHGNMPLPTSRSDYRVDAIEPLALGGAAIRKQVTVHLTNESDGPKGDLLIYIPRGVRKPVATFLNLNFSGNHTVTADPGVHWATYRTQNGSPVSEARGSSHTLAVEQIVARGYAVATMCYQDIEPDFIGGQAHGIRARGASSTKGDGVHAETSAIGTWAIGLSRAMDYLQRDKDIDAMKVIVMGHSRLGKTALWAAARDQRFAMVIASCSGEGGGALMRRNYGETIADLARVFPHWFSATFNQYGGRADRLPIDSHELIALIAPRPVYIATAEDDRWADPKGEFLAAVAAGPVYRLLGAEDLGTATIPPINTPIQRTIAFHMRSGGHDVTRYDWERFLDFADRHLQWR